MRPTLLSPAGLSLWTMFGLLAALSPAAGQDEICLDCISVRVGTPMVVRGPFPDELDAPLSALRLADGRLRAFTANSTTYAVEGTSLFDLRGQRTPVLEAGAPGSINDCGRWLTSLARVDGALLGLVHQEADCDYNEGRTSKSLAIASSTDDGLNWTDLGTVISGRDRPTPGTITGEGDCSMIDGQDGYLYAYCLRNSDWQTIAARAPASDPTQWQKYLDGAWSEPGLGGAATAIGFIGTGTAYMPQRDWVIATTTDRWFEGLRLSLSTDKVSFQDLDEPLMPIDGSDWARPAATALVAYSTMLDPETGSTQIGDEFLLAYIYVPPGEGFESRYLVLQPVSMQVGSTPLPTQAGLALTRWRDPTSGRLLSSAGPMAGPLAAYSLVEDVQAYLLTRAPDGVPSVKLLECHAGAGAGDIILVSGSCEGNGQVLHRTAGWVYLDPQPGTLPLYSCLSREDGSPFVSTEEGCEGLGVLAQRLGYGLVP